MANFIGGSAYSMVKDIAEGYILISPSSLKKFLVPELNQLTIEIEKVQREIRGEQLPQEDLQAIKLKNRKLQRLQQSVLIVQNFRQKNKR